MATELPTGEQGPRAAAPRFPDTRASVVERLRGEDPGARERALATVIETYWQPAYRHLRLQWRKGADDAADLTQSFFGAALERQFLATYDPARSRFRSFLRLCLDRHAANELEKSRREKRGGGARGLSLDFAGAEAELGARPGGAAADPDREFEREWMRSVLALALRRFRESSAARGKERRFALFERTYLGEEGARRPSQAELAAEHGVSPAHVNNELAAARREFREHVLAVLREISGTDQEFEQDARALLGADPEGGRAAP